jgi:hypothetical protein
MQQLEAYDVMGYQAILVGNMLTNISYQLAADKAAYCWVVTHVSS